MTVSEFLEKAATKSLINANFNYSNAADHKNLCCLRIGDISVKRTATLSVSVNKGADLTASENSRDVILTVSSSIDEMPNYTLTLLGGDGTTVNGTESQHVHTYSLAVGTYTYTLSVSDDRFVIAEENKTVTGTFKVEYSANALNVTASCTDITPSTMGTATLTVSGDDLPSNYTVIVKKDGSEIAAVKNGNVYTLNGLAAGEYAYVAEAGVLRKDGTFTVGYDETALAVKLETTAHSAESKGSATVTLTYEGEVMTRTLEVKDGNNQSVDAVNNGKIFTVNNLTAGNYSYTLTVGNFVKESTFTIDYVAASNMLFDPNNPDSVAQWTPDKVTLSQVAATESERAYLNITGSGWTAAQLSKFCFDKYDYDDTDVVSMWVYLHTKDNTAVKLGVFGSCTYRQFFQSNQWYEIIIPVNDFFELIQNNKLLPGNFKNAGSAMHKDLQNIRVGAISIKKQAVGYSTVYENGNVTITVNDADATFVLKKSTGTVVNATAVEGKAYTYDLSNGIYMGELTSMSDHFVAGEFKYLHYKDTNNYKAVTFERAIEFQVGNKLIDMSENHNQYTVASTTLTYQAPDASREAIYKGGYAIVGNVSWKSLSLTERLHFCPSYNDADLVSMWVYFDADGKGGTSNPSLFGVGEVAGGWLTKAHLPNDTWVKLYMPAYWLFAGIKTKTVAEGGEFIALNINGRADNGNFTNVSKIYLGDMQFEKSANVSYADGTLNIASAYATVINGAKHYGLQIASYTVVNEQGEIVDSLAYDSTNPSSITKKLDLTPGAYMVSVTVRNICKAGKGFETLEDKADFNPTTTVTYTFIVQ